MVNSPSSLPAPRLIAVPEEAPISHPGVILAPRELRNWLASLPMGNPPRCAEQMLQQFRLLVRDPKPGGKYPKLLAEYRQPLDQLLGVVNDRLQDIPESALPLDQLEYHVVELLRESAYGQLRIVNDLLASGKRPPLERLLSAMRDLARAQAIGHLRHQLLSPATWQTLLEVFLVAENQDLANTPGDRANGLPGEPATIRGLFFRVVIISLTDPYQHAAAEVAEWSAWMGRHHELISLSLLPQGPSAVPLDITGESTPLASARRGKPGPDTRYVVLDELLQRTQAEQDGNSGLHDALTALLRGRKGADQRRNPRQPRNHRYRLRLGLHNIYRRLSDLIGGSGGQVASATAEVASVQVNQSASGAAFRMASTIQPAPRIGELVLAEADIKGRSTPVGFCGRLRRLVASEGGAIEIGVEKLVGRIVPVMLSGPTTERARVEPIGLLQVSTDGAQYVLIASQGVYRQDETVTAEGPGARYRFRMTGLGERAGGTAAIQVEVA